MPTENPKISAYVPQDLFDRFKRFQDERGLTMSQATIALMSEYFGLEQTVKTSSRVTVGGITLERIEAIESELKRLSNLVDKRETASELLKVNEVSVQPPDNVESDKILEVIDNAIQNINESSLPLVILGELPMKIEISGNLLAKRLNIRTNKLSTLKHSLKADEFVKSVQKQDPDGVAWEPIKSRRGYVAVGNLSSELRSRLLRWITENSS